MDKFGIFNLLNSFYDFYKSNSKPQTEPLGQQTSEQSPQSQNDGGGFLSGLFGNKKEDSQAQSSPKSIQQKNQQAHPPLQNKMLLTMQTHQDLINRVNKNNYK